MGKTEEEKGGRVRGSFFITISRSTRKKKRREKKAVNNDRDPLKGRGGMKGELAVVNFFGTRERGGGGGGGGISLIQKGRKKRRRTSFLLLRPAGKGKRGGEDFVIYAREKKKDDVRFALLAPFYIPVQEEEGGKGGVARGEEECIFNTPSPESEEKECVVGGLQGERGKLLY